MADREFSTLEAVNPGYAPLRNGKSLAADSGKQVMTDNVGKEAITPYSDGIETTPHQQHFTATRDYHEPYADETQQLRRSRKWWWIGGAILLLVILGAVVGGLLGTRKSKSSSSTPVHKIAAVAFRSGNVDNTRVYYQDNAGMLIEAAKSAGNTWGFTKIGLPEKNNSALAAAVSRPGFPMEISVFYTDNKEVLHDLIYNATSQKWSQGIISQKNYKAYPNSSMSAMYNQCRLCTNTTLMTFQDENGFVQMAKFENSGWTLSQLDVDPVRRTGLALQPSYKANQADKLMLFHQKSNLNISLASWDPVSGWNFSKEIYNKAPTETPIAAASSYSNVTAGYETWRQLLKLSKEGVEVNTWSGDKNGWLRYDYQHTAFANETGTNVKIYGSLAVTATGSAFAVVENPPGIFSIQSYQMSDRLNGWQKTGNVTTWD